MKGSSSMNVLLIGSGGREHALAWKLAQSPLIGKLYAAPGNPGIAEQAELVALDPADHRAVIDFCRRHSIGLVVIGPEAPLVDGLADNLRAMGFLAFGPNRIPAQLEGSKGFTKDLCASARHPHRALRPRLRPARRRGGARGFRLSGGDQGRRARRRQGRDHRRDGRGGGARRSTRCSTAASATPARRW